MKVQVTVDGETQDVDIEFGNITLQESCVIEDVLGFEAYDRFLAEAALGDFRPKSLRALLFSKLKLRFPEMDVTDFELAFTDDAADAVEGGELGNEEGS